MLKKIYEKNRLYFALIWIALYIVIMNIALQVCGGFDHLAEKTVPQLLAPVGCIALLSAALTLWIAKNGQREAVGLVPFRGKGRGFLWFAPLILLSCINLKNGLALSAPLPQSLLMMVNLAAAGYVEEIIFRGFLFRAMAQSNLKSAVIVSAVTFGAGHIVNLANTADTAGVLLQVCYAIAIGFLYTAIVYRGGSLWPCIASHMFVNATSVFAPAQGPFTQGVQALLGDGPLIAEAVSAGLVILLSGGYALWIGQKAKMSAREKTPAA